MAQPEPRHFNRLSAPSGHVNVRHPLHRPHVLGALEGSWIGAALLAHAPLHLAHGFVLVFFHPLAQFALNVAQVIDAVPHQR